MTYGFTGKVLFVNLSTGENSVEHPDEQVYRQFLGGYGLGARIIYERQPAKADPLGPEAILGFTAGLLSGTGAPFCERYMAAGKSPLTGTWGDSNAGGYMGTAIKRAGFDAVFVTGISEKPVWLHICNEKVVLKDASHIWGQDTSRTEEILRRELNDEHAGIAAIGLAGEARSLISCIINDGGRAAGRSGLGAVMGSKRLKALAVQGGGEVAVADKRAFDRISSDIRSCFSPPSLFRRIMLGLLTPAMPYLTRLMAARGINPAPDMKTLIQLFSQQGTAAGLAMSSESGDSPVKNWSGIGFRDFPIMTKARRISDVNVIKYKTRGYRCGGTCPLGCGGFVTVPGGPFAVNEARKPEYETLAAFGTMVLDDNVESVIKCGDICNRYGIDTISAGTAVAFAIECYEAGIINKSDTGGLELSWGDASIIVSLTEMIGRREGFGEILADGVARASERIGRGAGKFAVHIHGQEPGMHDPKFGPSWATTYITDPTPGRHTAGGAAMAEVRGGKLPLKGIDMPPLERYKYQGKGAVHAAWSNFSQVVNCTGICMFASFLQVMPYVEIISAVTGWNYSSEELLETGERIQNMRQLFNVREGLKPGDFTLPGRLAGEPPLEAGPTAGITLDVDMMAKEYYETMDWDLKTGMPSAEKLKALEISEILKYEG